ncbi:MAG: glycosyltransferase, partial [Fidelibacterota bacterium]
MSKVDHTFAVLAFGKSPFLEDCIQSVMKQSVRGKIIICTSTPTLFIQNMSEKYAIELFINQNSIGIFSDWNFALEKASTQFVTLAHQDDLYHHYYLEKCASYFEDEFGILFPNYIDLEEDGMSSILLQNRIKSILLWPYLFTRCVESPFLKSLMLRFGNPIGCPGVMYNLDILREFKFSSRFN